MGCNLVVVSMVLVVAIVFFPTTTTTTFSDPQLRSLPRTKGSEVEETSRHRRTWPCCDRSGLCTNSVPPQCQCQDLVRSRHTSWRGCLRSPLSVEPAVYQ
ncbi:hypothetical protein MUK42_20698 [Musa troglodytarum]|uniref:Bowman-Birk serine protease inhibitors family domain-containing protein n=1 Tax=Musa troglodytarum TaxID=320322 RepID=A0A9E7FRG3_9LILI|nr:hypothetical protein MUK42_20698 [Musa troglodytarum]